jgi:hypothetical protein
LKSSMSSIVSASSPSSRRARSSSRVSASYSTRRL